MKRPNLSPHTKISFDPSISPLRRSEIIDRNLSMVSGKTIGALDLVADGVGICCLFLLFVLPHLSSVVDFSSTKATNKAQSIPSKKLDHLVFGLAAGVGFPDRLHCRDLSLYCCFTNIESDLRIQFLCIRHEGSEQDSHYNFSCVRCWKWSFFLSQCLLLITNNTSLDHLKSSNLVSVIGNVTYSKPERSMAGLNTFAYFIQLLILRENMNTHFTGS